MSIFTDTKPGPIATKAQARAQDADVLSVREDEGYNKGKFVDVYLASVGLAPGNAWCAAFVYFRLKDAANLLKKALPTSFPRSGYVPTMASYFKGKGLWLDVGKAKSSPSLVKPGDLIFFYFSSKGRLAHVGIVYAVGVDGVLTVEGNTSAPVGGVDRNGDGVYKKSRSWASLGKLGGFGRVDF